MTWLQQVMPGWTDEDIPSVAQDRAVIPGDVASAVFYLMMADEDLQASFEFPAIVYCAIAWPGHQIQVHSRSSCRAYPRAKKLMLPTFSLISRTSWL
jgi:hypothetical protein